MTNKITKIKNADLLEILEESIEVWKRVKDIPFDSHWTCGELWADLELRLPYGSREIPQALATGPAFYWNGKPGRESRSRYAAPMSSLVYRALAYDTLETYNDYLDYIFRNRIIQQLRILYADIKVQETFTRNLGMHYTTEAQKLFDIIYRMDDRVKDLPNVFDPQSKNISGFITKELYTMFHIGTDQDMRESLENWLTGTSGPKAVVVLGGPYSGRGRTASAIKALVSDLVTDEHKTVLDTATIAGIDADKDVRYEILQNSITAWINMMSKENDSSKDSFDSSTDDVLVVSVPAINLPERISSGVQELFEQVSTYVVWVEARSPQERIELCKKYTPEKFDPVVAAIARETHPLVDLTTRKNAIIWHVTN